jgi:transcriptional regulator with XRE-family HTH domain
MAIENILTDWRSSRGLTQRELSEKTGIHRAQIGSWESGRHSPNYKSIEQLAAFFGIDVVQFIAGPTAVVPYSKEADAEMVTVPMFDGMRSLVERASSGTFLIPHNLEGCVAYRVQTDMNAPELRPGDVVALKFGRRAPRSRLVVAIPENPETLKLAPVVCGFLSKKYDDGRDVIRPGNPMYPDFVGPFQVIGVIESLVRRDYAEAV